MKSDEHRVRVEPHGRTLQVSGAQPLLEAALDAGLNLPHSCKSGHCGSCRARLLEGDIGYPNGLPLGISASEEREGFVLLCQARARTDVVVEARFIAEVSEVEIKTLPCRIERLTPLAPDVLQVMLRLPAVASPNGCTARPARRVRSASARCCGSRGPWGSSYSARARCRCS